MQVSQYLCKDCVLFDFKAKDKKEALEKLARWASSILDGTSEKDILRVLTEREELGSTGIGGGVAIPHAKLSEIKKQFVFVAVSKKGVPFDSVDGEPVYIFFLLLAPDGETANYLKLLARVSKLIKRKDLLSKVQDAKGKDQVREIIRQLEFER